MARKVEDGSLRPGRLYRDLDGSLVHLVSVDRELCIWVSVSRGDRKHQVTHRDNFQRRFRCFEDEACETKAAA